MYVLEVPAAGMPHLMPIHHNACNKQFAIQIHAMPSSGSQAETLASNQSSNFAIPVLRHLNPKPPVGSVVACCDYEGDSCPFCSSPALLRPHRFCQVKLDCFWADECIAGAGSWLGRWYFPAEIRRTIDAGVTWETMYVGMWAVSDRL